MTLENRRPLDPTGPPEADRPPAGVARLPRPWFCMALIGVCAALFLADLGGVPERLGLSSTLAELLLLDARAVRAGQMWRVLTWAFVHGSILHVGLNMWVVTSLGFGLERALGPWRMALLSLVGQLGATAAVLLSPGAPPTLGASGLILSWAGALFVIARDRRALGWWLVQIAALSFIPGISWAGHLGGFLAGVPVGGALRVQRFNLLAPVLLFVAAVVVVVAAHHT